MTVSAITNSKAMHPDEVCDFVIKPNGDCSPGEMITKAQLVERLNVVTKSDEKFLANFNDEQIFQQYNLLNDDIRIRCKKTEEGVSFITHQVRGGIMYLFRKATDKSALPELFRDSGKANDRQKIVLAYLKQTIKKAVEEGNIEQLRNLKISYEQIT